MIIFIEMMNSIREFIDTGGQVLTVIAGVICLMWFLIFERLYFFLGTYKRVRDHIINSWNARTDKSSWNAEQIRVAHVSRITEQLNKEFKQHENKALLNLASNEYGASINEKKLAAPIINVHFREYRNGYYGVGRLYSRFY